MRRLRGYSVVTERTGELVFFEGEGCRSTDEADLLLPRGARRAQTVSPQVGQALEEQRLEVIRGVR